MTTSMRSPRSRSADDRGRPDGVRRLVKIDLTVAAIALTVVVSVTAADHATQGNLSALAGLLGG